MTSLDLLDWDAPGPYRVAFSTRNGGVSEGPFTSLNLGILTEDDHAAVVRNRALLCDAVGADPDSVSAQFGESNLGGTTVVAKVVIGR